MRGIKILNMKMIGSATRSFSHTACKSITTIAVIGAAQFALCGAASAQIIAAPLAPAAHATSTTDSALSSASGGIYERAEGTETQADPQFRSLFLSWKKLDQIDSGRIGVSSRTTVSIPSQKPVAQLSFTSNFGYRSDPFRGGRAMHAGVDIPGPVGTPIYATADGVIGRAQWLGGYGNYIEIEHGQGIETRYGHLSAILVKPYDRVKRGDLIGRMGSTGRSTGSHLHYEVRLDGRAVNPIPFLQSSDYLVAMQRSRAEPLLAMGGPEKE